MDLLAAALSTDLGREVRGERLRRGWTIRRLAERARLSVSTVHGIEAGVASSVDGYVRISAAFGWEPAFSLQTPRVPGAQRDVDPVHAAMGEVETAHFRPFGLRVTADEPYQHFQFSGLADVVVVDPVEMALLHLENKTRFPDVQGFSGAWNAKRAYLPADLLARLELPRARWRSITHVVIALWSSEVLHTLRLRSETIRSACPDAVDAFQEWWEGKPPKAGISSSIVVFDPLPGRRSSRRTWIGLDDALDRSTDPRYRGYADALEAFRRAGIA